MIQRYSATQCWNISVSLYLLWAEFTSHCGSTHLKNTQKAKQCTRPTRWLGTARSLFQLRNNKRQEVKRGCLLFFVCPMMRRTTCKCKKRFESAQLTEQKKHLNSSTATAVFKALPVQRRLHPPATQRTLQVQCVRVSGWWWSGHHGRRWCHRSLTICYTLFKWGNKKLLMILHCGRPADRLRGGDCASNFLARVEKSPLYGTHYITCAELKTNKQTTKEKRWQAHMMRQNLWSEKWILLS